MARARGGKDRPAEEGQARQVKPRTRRAAAPKGAKAEAAKPEKRPARARKTAIPARPKARPQSKTAAPPTPGAQPKARPRSTARPATEAESTSRRPRATRPATGAGPQKRTPRAKVAPTEAIAAAPPRAAVHRPEPDVDLPEPDVRLPVGYGLTRVRLLARNPESLFAHWNVDPEAVGSVGPTKGPAAINLVLRLFGPGPAGPTLVRLPAVTRTLYVRADHGPGKYRAELGLILASGQFVRLAESNIVSVPRSGPSSRPARQRVRVQRDRFPEVRPEVLEETVEELPRPDPVPTGLRAGRRRPTQNAIGGAQGGSSELFRAAETDLVHSEASGRYRAGGSDLNRR